MNIPIEVALGDGDVPRWITVHVKAGMDGKTLARRCALMIGADPDEFTKIARADRHNSFEQEKASVFVQPLAKFILVHRSLEYPRPLTVLAFGDDSSGQLGRRASPVQYHEARPVPGLLGRRVIGVAAGSAHSAFVLESGALLTCGDGSLGRLGYGETFAKEKSNLQAVPRRVEFPSRCCVTLVRCAGARTFCVTNKGQVFVFGEKGACLGLGEEGCENHIYSPTEIPKLCNVQRLSATQARVLAIVDERSVYGWGDESNGTIFQPKSLGWENMILPEDVLVTDVAAGRDKSHYSLIATSDGTFYEKAPGVETTVFTKILHISNDKLHHSTVASGCNLSILVSEDGDVMAIPADTSFAHGERRRLSVKRGGAIRKVEAGENHVVLITAEGRPFGFGTSEAGQLTVRRAEVLEPIWLGNGLDCVESAAIGDKHTLLSYSSYVTSLVLAHEDDVDSLNGLASSKTFMQATRESCAGISSEGCSVT